VAIALVRSTVTSPRRPRRTAVAKHRIELEIFVPKLTQAHHALRTPPRQNVAAMRPSARAHLSWMLAELQGVAAKPVNNPN
jgi:hypothetical protein